MRRLALLATAVGAVVLFAAYGLFRIEVAPATADFPIAHAVIVRDDPAFGTYLALASNDKRLRADAMEFLDTLTTAGDRGTGVHHDLRELLRVVADDLPPGERVSRVRRFLDDAPRDADGALEAMLDDPDDALTTLAAYHALAVGTPGLVDAVARVCAARPNLLIASSIGLRAGATEPLRRRRVEEEATHGR